MILTISLLQFKIYPVRGNNVSIDSGSSACAPYAAIEAMTVAPC